MKGFAEWLAQRRYRMILLAAALVRVPILGIIGQAIIAFAVLRRGAAEGLMTALAASALIVLTLSLAGGNPAGHFVVVLLSWLPAFGLAVLLRKSQSLSLTVQAATVVSMVAVGLVFAFSDPVHVAQDLLTRYMAEVGDRVGPMSEAAIIAWSQVLTGMIAAVALLASVGAVFIGRWWQAALHRPGGFGSEFRQLRLGMVVCALASVVFVAAGLSGLAWLQNVTLVLLSAYMLQGLAVTHAFIGAAGSGYGTVWLAAVYLSLLLAIQFAVPAIAGLGFLDSWFNFRSRLARR